MIQPRLHTLHGLYAITDSQLMSDDETLLSNVTQAFEGGVKILQYRDKSDDSEKRLRQASLLKDLCDQHGVTFLINDDPQLAFDAKADGVHLGQTDGAVLTARALLGDEAIIGVTCHDQLNLAKKAIDEGANYIAFGAFFPSKTKPNATPAPMHLITEAKTRFHCPVVAIGGITVDNAPQLINQGVDMLAVIHSLFSADDIRLRAAEFTHSF